MTVTRSEIFNSLKKIHLFKGLDDDHLYSLIEKIEVVSYEEGRIIFETNAVANDFFLIYNGQISIELDTKEGLETLSFLQTDDYFGEDVLEPDAFRKTTAKATKDSILLSISSDDLLSFIDEHPNIGPAFDLILASYRNLIKIPITWCRPEEAVYFISRAHLYFAATQTVIPGLIIVATLILSAILFFQTTLDLTILSILSGFFLLFGLGWALWSLIDWSNDYYLITNQRVVYIEKVVFLYESRQETPLGAILSITKQTDLLGRNLSYGDIDIRTYTGVLHFKHIGLPDEVIALLEERWERAKKLLSEADRKEMEKLLRERISPEESDHDKTSEAPEFSGHTEVKSSRLISFLADLFSLRKEVNEIITYHTHWFILLKMVSLPSLTILIIILLAFFNFSGALSFLSTTFFHLLLTFLGLLAIGWWIYQFVDWRNDVYIITQDQVVDVNRKPLGLEDRRSAPIKNIQSIEYKRLGFIGVLLNFGTVFIRIGDTQFTFDFVHNPSEVQRELFERYIELMKMEKNAQTDRDRRRMADWLDVYHHILQEQGGEEGQTGFGSKLE